MLRLVRECHDFGFDTGAVAWTDTLNLSVVKRGVCESAAQGVVNFFIRVASPALKLLELAWLADIRKTMEIVFTVLGFH